MPDVPRVPMRDDLASLEASGFAFPGSLRDELTALALAGTKTTTDGRAVRGVRGGGGLQDD